MRDVDDLGGAALHHRIADKARTFARDLDVEPLLDDVDDLVDDEAHAPAAIGKHQNRHGAILLELAAVDADERHELIAILHQILAVGGFDAPAVDLLEPGNERQQHRLGLLRAGAKNQQRRQIVFDDGFGLADLDLLALRRYAPERLRYSVRVNDHDYRAVAKDGRAGKDREMPQLRGERLDHDFFGVEYAVDHNAKDLAADLGDDDEASVVRRPARAAAAP